MSNEYKDWLNDLSPEQRANYDICMKYPILIPERYLYEVFTGDYDYSFCCYNEIPEGWRKAFGEDWACEVQQAVDNYYAELKNIRGDEPIDEFDELHILQLKEKYGVFTQYFTKYTPELRKVIKKYQDLSEKTCIHCGKPAKYRTTDWISPWCEDCIQLVQDKFKKISK